MLVDKLVDNLPSILSLIGLFITAVYGPKVVAKMQGKQKMKQVKMEGDSRAEELYVTHIEKTLDRYEKQIKEMEKEFNRRMEEAERRFNLRFDELKREMEKEKEKERNYYLKEIEVRDDRIEELEIKNTELEHEIAFLKEEANEIIE